MVDCWSADRRIPHVVSTSRSLKERKRLGALEVDVHYTHAVPANIRHDRAGHFPSLMKSRSFATPGCCARLSRKRPALSMRSQPRARGMRRSKAVGTSASRFWQGLNPALRPQPVVILHHSSGIPDESPPRFLILLLQESRRLLERASDGAGPTGAIAVGRARRHRRTGQRHSARC